MKAYKNSVIMCRLLEKQHKRLEKKDWLLLNKRNKINLKKYPNYLSTNLNKSYFPNIRVFKINRSHCV